MLKQHEAVDIYDVWTSQVQDIPAYEEQVGVQHFDCGDMQRFAIGRDGKWVALGFVYLPQMAPAVFTHPDYQGQGYARQIAVAAQRVCGRVNVSAGEYTPDGLAYVNKMIEEGVCDGTE